MKRLRQSLGEESEEEIEEEPEEESVEKPIITTVRYGKDEMNKQLNNKAYIEILKSYKLELPSEYKDKRLEEFQDVFNKGMEETAKLKKAIRNVASSIGRRFWQ